MDFLYTRKNRIWLIAGFWLLIALLLTTRSAVGQLHRTGMSTWLQNFYYQATGALVWALFTPLLIRFYKRFDFNTEQWGKSLLAHVSLSIPLALLHRALALLLDYGARIITDMNFFGSLNPWELLVNYRYVILESAFSSLITYWAMLALLMAISYYRKYKDGLIAPKVLAPQPVSSPKLVRVKQQGEYQMVAIGDLIFCEASGNYVLLHTATQTYKLRQTMGSFEKQLDERFARVHRSTIVNISQVESFKHLYQGEYLLRLSNGRQVSSTRSYRKNLAALLST